MSDEHTFIEVRGAEGIPPDDVDVVVGGLAGEEGFCHLRAQVGGAAHHLTQHRLKETNMMDIMKARK